MTYYKNYNIKKSNQKANYIAIKILRIKARKSMKIIKFNLELAILIPLFNKGKLKAKETK